MARRTSRFSWSDARVRSSSSFNNGVLSWSRVYRDNASPDIPLSFRYGDTDYALHSNSSVRQNYKTIVEHDPRASVSPATADFVIESILDSSTNETRTLCKVRLTDLYSNSMLTFCLGGMFRSYIWRTMACFSFQMWFARTTFWGRGKSKWARHVHRGNGRTCSRLKRIPTSLCLIYFFIISYITYNIIIFFCVWLFPFVFWLVPVLLVNLTHKQRKLLTYFFLHPGINHGVPSLDSLGSTF